MSTSKNTVRSIGAELAALPQVKELLKKYGLSTVSYAGGIINHDSFTIKLQFGHEVEQGKSGPSRFAQHGLPEDIIGKVIKLGSSSYTIREVKPQNAQGSLKKCVVIEGSGGGRYVTTAADVLRALNLSQPGTLIKRPVPGMEGVMTPELKAKFESLASRLSPENLAADGERSAYAQRIEYKNIMAEWAKLETELGRKVSQSEFPY